MSRPDVLIYDGMTMESLGKVHLGRLREGIAVNPSTNRIYAVEKRLLHVIDGATLAIIASVLLRGDPWDVAVNKATNRVYVTNRSRDVVQVVDGITNSLLAEIRVGTAPFGVAVNELTNRVYVTNWESITVSIIDGATSTVIATIPACTRPNAIAANPVTNRIYVGCYDVIDVIDGATNSRAKTIVTPFSGLFQDAAINSQTNRVYLTQFEAGVVAVLDGEADELIDVLYVGNGAFGVTVNETTNRIYVANLESLNISMLLGNEMLGNGSFDALNDDGSVRTWKPVNLSPEDGPDVGDLPDLPYLYEGKWSFRLVGAPGLTKSLEQRVQAFGPAGATLNLEGVSMAENASPTGGAYQVKARLHFTDGTPDGFAVNFPGGTHGWRRRAKSYVAPKPFDRIVVTVTYADQPATSRVWFDAVHLWMGD